jgi:hypothetical protein
VIQEALSRPRDEPGGSFSGMDQGAAEAGAADEEAAPTGELGTAGAMAAGVTGPAAAGVMGAGGTTPAARAALAQISSQDVVQQNGSDWHTAAMAAG